MFRSNPLHTHPDGRDLGHFVRVGINAIVCSRIYQVPGTYETYVLMVHCQDELCTRTSMLPYSRTYWYAAVLPFVFARLGAACNSKYMLRLQAFNRLVGKAAKQVPGTSRNTPERRHIHTWSNTNTGCKYIHKRVSIRTTHYWYEYNVLLIVYQVYTSTQYWCSCSMNVSLECLYRLTPDTDGGDSKHKLESKPTYTRTGDECAEQDSARNGPSSIHTRHLSESPDGENIDTDYTTGLLLGCSHLIQLILLLQKLLPLLLPLLLHRLRVHRIILPGTQY